MRSQRRVVRGLIVRWRGGLTRKPASRQKLVPPFLKLIEPFAVRPRQAVCIVARFGDYGHRAVTRRVLRILRRREIQAALAAVSAKFIAIRTEEVSMAAVQARDAVVAHWIHDRESQGGIDGRRGAILHAVSQHRDRQAGICRLQRNHRIESLERDFDGQLRVQKLDVRKRIRSREYRLAKPRQPECRLAWHALRADEGRMRLALDHPDKRLRQAAARQVHRDKCER